MHRASVETSKNRAINLQSQCLPNDFRTLKRTWLKFHEVETRPACVTVHGQWPVLIVSTTLSQTMIFRTLLVFVALTVAQASAHDVDVGRMLRKADHEHRELFFGTEWSWSNILCKLNQTTLVYGPGGSILTLLHSPRSYLPSGPGLPPPSTVWMPRLPQASSTWLAVVRHVKRLLFRCCR